MPRNGSGSYALPAGNPVSTGDTISSTWANDTLSDIATALTNSIAKDGQTDPTANLPMATYKHTNVGNASARNQYAAACQVQDQGFTWCSTAGGTADAFTLTPSPAITAYSAGQLFVFLAVGTNTAAVTANVSGVGAKAVQFGGNALTAGAIQSGKLYAIRYDGTQFQVQSALPMGVWNIVAGWTLKGGAQGPIAVVDNGAESNYFEFTKTGYTERGSIGALGVFEMNMSYNMDYKTGVHRLYNQAQDANWIAMNQNGVYLQYAPATVAAGDVWAAGGNLYNWYVLNNGNMYARGNGAYGAAPIASARCYVKGTTNTSAAYGFYATNSDGTEVFRQYNNGYLFNLGNTGIGGNPLASARLYVKGETSDNTTYAHYVTNSTGTETFTIKNDGQINAIGAYNVTTASAANVFVDSAGKLQRSTSALKYKRDVRDLEAVDLSKLRPVRYKSRIEADGERDFIGFIADEAHEAELTELVSYGPGGEIEGFQYDRVTALLWKKCQELEKRLSELEAA